MLSSNDMGYLPIPEAGKKLLNFLVREAKMQVEDTSTRITSFQLMWKFLREWIILQPIFHRIFIWTRIHFTQIIMNNDINLNLKSCISVLLGISMIKMYLVIKSDLKDTILGKEKSQLIHNNW